jgi:CBS domain-containing protein
MPATYRLQDSVDDWMTRDIYTIEPKKTILDVAKIMNEKSIGSVIVQEKPKGFLKRTSSVPLGIITDTDIIRKIVAQNKKAISIQVSALMSSPLKTIEYDSSLADSAVILKDNNIRRLPVMKKGKLSGMLSTTDMMYGMLNLERFYALKSLASDLAEKKPEEQEISFEAKYWMVAPIAKITKTDTVLKAAEIMSEHKCGSLPVLLGKYLIGIITDTDIVRKVVAYEKDYLLTVDQFMTSIVITAKPDDSIVDIAKIMADHKLKRIPIVEDNIILGILSVIDIINVLLSIDKLSNAQDLIKMMYRGNAGYFR